MKSAVEAPTADSSRPRQSQSLRSATPPRTRSQVCELVAKARHLTLFQRIAATGRVFAGQPGLRQEAIAEQPASMVDDCPDVLLQLTVVALPTSRDRRAAAKRPMFSDEWGASEDWGTYVGTGGYCPQ